MAPRTVPDSGRITEPGEYVLRNDRRVRAVTPSARAVLRIESDGVSLDGRGHAVVGNGVSDTTAIATGDGAFTAVTVENVVVRAWEVGVRIRNVERATVRGVTAAENSYGVSFERVAAARVADCEVRENLIGVAVDAAATFEREGGEIADNRLADVHRERDC